MISDVGPLLLFFLFLLGFSRYGFLMVTLFLPHLYIVVGPNGSILCDTWLR